MVEVTDHWKFTYLKAIRSGRAPLADATIAFKQAGRPARREGGLMAPLDLLRILGAVVAVVGGAGESCCSATAERGPGPPLRRVALA